MPVSKIDLSKIPSIDVSGITKFATFFESQQKLAETLKNFEKIIRNELQVAGSWNSISAPFPGREWNTALNCMSKGKIDIKPLITHRIALNKAPEMFGKLYKREEFFVKVIIKTDDQE